MNEWLNKKLGNQTREIFNSGVLCGIVITTVTFIFIGVLFIVLVLK